MKRELTLFLSHISTINANHKLLIFIRESHLAVSYLKFELVTTYRNSL